MSNIKIVRKRADNKRKNDPDRIEYMRQLQKKPHIIKTRMICTWKRRGVICDDFDTLYQNYLDSTICDLCGILFDNTIKATSKCLDHDHTTGLFRNMLCNTCNWTHTRMQQKKELTTQIQLYRLKVRMYNKITAEFRHINLD